MNNTAFKQNSVEQGALVPFREDVHDRLLDYIRKTDFKRLLHQFSRRLEETSSKSVAVLSLYPEDGRSFLVSTLALGYAQYMGARVLIVDSVQQTQQSSLYFQGVLGDDGADVVTELPSGLVEVLSTESFFEEETYDTADFKIGNHIRALESKYDLVLLDTCSIASADVKNLDPLILAKTVDSAIVLTSKRSLSAGNVSRVNELVSEFDLTILGTVHNSWGIQ